MATPLTVRVVEHQAQIFRRFWRGSATFYVLNPLLFLAAIGFGLGGLVQESTGNVGGVPYDAFVAPGLLAASAMLGATAESMWPVMAGTKWVRTFHAMVATPVGADDVYGGFVVWTSVRVSISASAFLIVAALLGGVPSLWGVLAVPAAVLCAAAFAAPLAAYAATQDSDVTFPLILRLGIVPLFLFSGTFFPVSELPAGLRAASFLSPLWHGVELCRAATTGSAEWGAVVVHVAVLTGCVAAGWLWGTRTFTRKLAQ